MRETGNAVRRKISGKNAEATLPDVESGSIEHEKPSHARNVESQRTEDKKWYDNWICTLVLLMTIFVLFKLDYWYISTPPEIKAAQLKILDDEIINFAKILKEREGYLYDRLSSVSEERDGHQEALFEIETEHGAKVDALKDSAGVGEEVSKLKEEIARLNKEKESSMQRLQEKIKKSEEELTVLHDLIGQIKIDSSLFCDDCPFVQGDLKTTCGKRKAYVMRKHRQTEEEVVQGIIQVDPNCLKKK